MHPSHWSVTTITKSTVVANETSAFPLNVPALNQHARAHSQTVRFTSTAGVPTPTEKTLLPDPERRRLSAVYSVPRRDESTDESARAREACRRLDKDRIRAAVKRQ